MSDSEFQDRDEYMRDMAETFTDVTVRAPADGARIWPPTVDVRETDRKYVIEADMPGRNLKDIDVRVESDRLTFESSVEEEHEASSDEFLRKERYARHFRRTFRLPEDVNQERIDAKYTDGVLIINLPRAKTADNSVSREVKVSGS